MLDQFLTSNRTELVTRCRVKAATRYAPVIPPAVINHGIPRFLQQLVEALRLEQTPPAQPVAPESTQTTTEIGRTASLHGTELLRLGYSVDQVVHEYGDVCQAVTELAGERDEDISAVEFRILNRCLDDAIADAVTSFGHARETLINDQAITLEYRLRMFSEEQRRLLDIAIHSYSAIKTGTVGLTGATGTLLIHALEDLRSLTDRTLPEIRLAAPRSSPVSSL
ncbi:MAG: hypothetical protein H7Y39_13155 [Nitrospiraceae bacterium]|nr:hypothetical protein [Nitrospiraceae bacterium]